MRYHNITEWELDQIIDNARPLHDDLVCALAVHLKHAWQALDDVQAELRASQSESFERARAAAGINLSWILNLDKIVARRKDPESGA